MPNKVIEWSAFKKKTSRYESLSDTELVSEENTSALNMEVVNFEVINYGNKKYDHINIYIKISEDRYVVAQLHIGTYNWRIKRDKNGYTVRDYEGKYYPACQYTEETLLEFAEEYFGEQSGNGKLDGLFDEPDEYSQRSNPDSIPYVSSCCVDFRTGEIKSFKVKVGPSKRYVDIGIHNNEYYIIKNDDGLSVYNPYSSKERYCDDTQYDTKAVFDAVKKYTLIMNGNEDWGF